MNFDEAGKLLRLIESYDRAPFRPEAVDLWFEALRRVTYEDAEAAVHHIYRIAGHDEKGGIRRLLPIDVARPANAIAESRRRRVAQAAIGGPPMRLGPPTGEEARAAVAAARAKIAAAEARYRERIAA